MTSIQITSKIDFEQLIAGMAQLETSELEKCIEQARLLLAKRRGIVVSDEERSLLSQINQGLSEKTELRYSALREKLRTETITAAENDELTELTKEVEQADVNCLEALINLSQLSQTSLSRLMETLHVWPPSVELSMSSVEKGENPWLRFNGIFKDDPDFAEIMQDMQAVREEKL